MDPIDAPSSTARLRVLGRVADQLVARDTGHPLRVAVDGITAAGKTTIARELAVAVAERGRPSVHLSSDGFHRPRADRYRQGRESPDGYYEDAFDRAGLIDAVLAPLGPGGTGRFRREVLDLATDRRVEDPPEQASADTVLLVDGTFLQHPAFAGWWDEIIWLHAGFEQAEGRAAIRDVALFGGEQQVRTAYRGRYHAACRRYLAEVAADLRATIVIDNDDVTAPRLVRIGGDADAIVALFSYGTLQLEPVQSATFGRPLVGRRDRIVGFAQGWITIQDPAVVAASGSDRHPIVRAGGDSADTVSGTVLELTTAELAAADLYEVDDYRRVLAPLAGGGEAWVYVAT